MLADIQEREEKTGTCEGCACQTALDEMLHDNQIVFKKCCKKYKKKGKKQCKSCPKF